MHGSDFPALYLRRSFSVAPTFPRSSALCLPTCTTHTMPSPIGPTNSYRSNVTVDAIPSFIATPDHTSRLLEAEVSGDQASDRHEALDDDDQSSRAARYQQPFLGYDEEDVRALSGSGSGSAGNSQHTTSRAVVWKGCSLFSLAWELLGVVVSLCFLGTPSFPVLFLAAGLNVVKDLEHALHHWRESPRVLGRAR